MNRPYIEELRIENYGCIKDATFELTPLHALIGPNDSGKSTVLRAMRTLGFSQHVPGDAGRLERAMFAGIDRGNVRLTARAGDESGSLFVGSDKETLASLNGVWSSWNGQLPAKTILQKTPLLSRALSGSLVLRLDPDALRAPQPLIPEGAPARFIDERGTGLGSIYDAIMVRDIEVYLRLNQGLTELFPNVKSISLVNPTSGTKAMGVKLVDGTFVSAEQMSDGLLYYLAYAALPYLEPASILLVEEPENGLHPARIAEVMRVLREISKTTQVLIATHNPLVVNELQPDEVTIVTRTREHGTKGVLMKDTPNFEERSKVYALGELWVSYANGEDEAPLLQGGPRT